MKEKYGSPEFQVGEEVIVKYYPECEFYWVDQMDRMIGKNATIRECSWNEEYGMYCYGINEDVDVCGEHLFWCKNCFDLAPIQEPDIDEVDLSDLDLLY